MHLAGRSAIVTGSGGTGCGRAIALRLAGEGAMVIVSDTNMAGGEETLRLIESSGGRAAFHAADMRQESQVRDLVAFAANQFGPLGLLVNNATAPFAHGYEMEHWLTTVETDFIGPLLATRYAVEAMREATSLPLAVGFGISTPEQAGAVAKMADGVVVGSAFVRLLEKNASEAQIEAFARSLRDGMDEGR